MALLTLTSTLVGWYNLRFISQVDSQLQQNRLALSSQELLIKENLMERLLRVASPLGLYAEEFEVERARHLGNFPQAFSHLALIQAAGRIVLSDFREELSL